MLSRHSRFQSPSGIQPALRLLRGLHRLPSLFCLLFPNIFIFFFIIIWVQLVIIFLLFFLLLLISCFWNPYSFFTKPREFIFNADADSSPNDVPKPSRQQWWCFW